jgi:hypothetical protein
MPDTVRYRRPHAGLPSGLVAVALRCPRTCVVMGATFLQRRAGDPDSWPARSAVPLRLRGGVARDHAGWSIGAGGGGGAVGVAGQRPAQRWMTIQAGTPAAPAPLRISRASRHVIMVVCKNPDHYLTAMRRDQSALPGPPGPSPRPPPLARSGTSTCPADWCRSELGEVAAAGCRSGRSAFV